MENLKIVALSDTHGYLPKIEESFDLLLICGDITPVQILYYGSQISWLQNEFADWVNSLPFKDEHSRVVVTWGNHDFAGERITKAELDNFYKATHHRIAILKNEEYEYHYLTENGENKLKIFGTPYCKIFGSWAFMVPNEKLKEKYGEIPENCDILISHDAPDINNLGLIQMGPYCGENAGNIFLSEVIKEKKPKVSLCGHIHSGNHEFMKVGETWMANVSYVNEEYVPSHQVLAFQINRETKDISY